MKYCNNCGREINHGRCPRCDRPSRLRNSRRNDRDTGNHNEQPPAQPFTLPPGCHLLYARCKGCEPGEGVALLGWGEQVVARQYPDLKPGEVNLVLR